MKCCTWFKQGEICISNKEYDKARQKLMLALKPLQHEQYLLKYKIHLTLWQPIMEKICQKIKHTTEHQEINELYHAALTLWDALIEGPEEMLIEIGRQFLEIIFVNASCKYVASILQWNSKNERKTYHIILKKFSEKNSESMPDGVLLEKCIMAFISEKSIDGMHLAVLLQICMEKKKNFLIESIVSLLGLQSNISVTHNTTRLFHQTIKDYLMNPVCKLNIKCISNLQKLLARAEEQFGIP